MDTLLSGTPRPYVVMTIKRLEITLHKITESLTERRDREVTSLGPVSRKSRNFSGAFRVT